MCVLLMERLLYDKCYCRVVSWLLGWHSCDSAEVSIIYLHQSIFSFPTLLPAVMSQLFCQTGELCGKCYSLQLQICHCAWHGLLMTTFISKSRVSLCCWRVDFVITQNIMKCQEDEVNEVCQKCSLSGSDLLRKNAHTNTLFIFCWKHLITYQKHKHGQWKNIGSNTVSRAAGTSSKFELHLASPIHTTGKKKDFSLNLLNQTNKCSIQLFYC